MKDLIIEEIRKFRKENEEICKLKGISFKDYLYEIQNKYQNNLVNFDNEININTENHELLLTL